VFETHLSVDGETFHPPTQDGLHDFILKAATDKWEEKEREFTPELCRRIEREIKLRMIDTHWKDHLLNMDHLKEGVGFEGYAQKDPLVVYQKKGFEMFSQMIFTIKEATLERFFHIHFSKEEAEERQQIFRAPVMPQRIQMRHDEASAPAPAPDGAIDPTRPPPVAPVSATIRRQGEKVGRNDPCPCGSGKKFKKCHGIG
jgi:preprotein translocase subunit SecA